MNTYKTLLTLAAACLLAFPAAAAADALPGDLDNSGSLDLGDAVIAIGITANASTAPFTSAADANGDGRITLAEAMTVLRAVAAANPAPPPLMGGAVQSGDPGLAGSAASFAGQWEVAGHDDGTGAAATFYYPAGITTDGTYLYLSEDGAYDFSLRSQTGSIRRIHIATGDVTTLVDRSKFLRKPGGLTTDGVYLYGIFVVGSSIQRIDMQTGELTYLSRGTLTTLGDITTDGTWLYVTDTATDTIHKVEFSVGTYTQVADLSGIGLKAAEGLTTDGTYLYVVGGADTVTRVSIADGTYEVITDFVSGGPLDPQHVTTDGDNLYIATLHGSGVHKVELATGNVTVLVPWACDPGESGDCVNAWLTTDGNRLFLSGGGASHTVRVVE